MIDFMSLEMGTIVDGRVVAKLPIMDDVINRVEQLGLEQNQRYRQSKMLQYEWRIDKPIGDDDIVSTVEEPSAIIPEPIVPQDPGPNPFIPPVKATLQGAEGGKMEERALPQDKNRENKETARQQRQHTHGTHQGAEGEVGASATNGVAPDYGEGEILFQNEEEEIIFYDDPDSPTFYEAEEEDDEELERETDDADEVHIDIHRSNNEQEDSDNESIYEQGEVKASTDEDKLRRGSHWDSGPGYGRGRRSKNKMKRYGHGMTQVGRKKAKATETAKTTKLHSFLQVKFRDLNKEQKREFFEHALNELRTTGKTNLMERYTTGLLFAHMTAKQGITKYGREAEIKLLAEFKQLMEYKVFHGRKASELTDQQKVEAANMINLIEEKINRGHTPENPVLRGRSVFNGRKQKGIYPKEESVDAVFLTFIIAALQGREKAVTDIKGAYLNAKMRDLVIMKITGPEVGLFCEIDPKLEEFVTQEKGKDVLYVQLDKALYGCVQSALLWYELYSETLMGIGFELNPYDPCVANAMIDGKQCTVCWYVDDNIITHAR